MTFLNRLGGDRVIPVVLDWAIRNGTCPSAPKGDNNENGVEDSVALARK